MQFLVFCFIVGVIFGIPFWRVFWGVIEFFLWLILVPLVGFVLICFVCAAISFIGEHWRMPAADPTQAPAFYTAPQPTPTPTPAIGPTQAERDANWQRILDMRAAAAVPTPSVAAQPGYAPRAQLVRLPQ
jgi:hypothetical protein